MTIAIPLSAGKLSPHFGHCEHFALFQLENGKIADKSLLTPPPHEPGLLPQWLKEQGVSLVIAGGMGQRAQDLFTSSGVEVICGAPPQGPAVIIDQYLNGNLETEDNTCDH